MWVDSCIVKYPSTGDSGVSLPIPGFPSPCRHCPLKGHLCSPNQDLPSIDQETPSLFPWPGPQHTESL